MRVLVLGADGFVGRRTIAALAQSGWATPVAGVRRAGEQPARMMVDATDAAALAAAVAGVDAVVNCIAGDAGTITGNARALAGAIGTRRLVHLSSMAVYGSTIGVVDEDAPLLADTGPYAAAKAEAERMLAGTGAIILRPGCIYGPGSTQWTLRIARLLAARRIGDLGAMGDGCSNLVHVDDVVTAILAGLRHGGRGAYNLAMPDAPDWNGYFTAFARVLGRVPVARIPDWRVRIETRALAMPLKLAERISGALPPPIPPSLARLWSQDIRLTSARATGAFAVDWTPFARGLAESAAWCAPRLRQPA